MAVAFAAGLTHLGRGQANTAVGFAARPTPARNHADTAQLFVTARFPRPDSGAENLEI